MEDVIWRAGDDLLVKRGDSFVVLAPSGKVTAWHSPSSTSDEDDLWRTAQQVIGADLVERTTVDRWGGEERVHEERVLLRGLRPVEDEATKRFVETALAAADTATARAREERARVAHARVEAIDGAFEDFGVERAQAALRRRIVDWDDERAADLLRLLISLGRARVGAEVLAVYARGCLFACFQAPGDASAQASGGARRPELAVELMALAGELEADAEGQELSDALQNAAAFRRAAHELRRAAQLL